MAHQCLKCGRSYPDGSPQILKGCEGCKGTRFFYTQEPIGEQEREELAARAQDELGRTEGDRPRERRIPTKGDLPLGDEKDWVSMGPGNLRTIVEDVVRRAQEKKPTFRVGAPGEGEAEGEADGSREGAPPLAEWVRKRQRELAGDESRGSEPKASEPEASPDAAAGAGAANHPEPSRSEGDSVPQRDEDGVVYRRSNRAQRLTREREGEPEPPAAGDPGPGREPEGSGSFPVRGLQGEPGEGSQESEGSEETPSLDPEGERPETVEVLEQGVYDLDVERLLEKNPIVVHKDGKYSLHLPSLMESLGKKRR